MTDGASTTPPASPPPDRHTLRRIRAGVTVGTALEWFDFYLFASMAALVFGRVFFPSADPTAGTLAAFATFAVGFIARPLGGIVFGFLGDRIGRKRVLTATFLMMGGASVLIGAIPSYTSIGVLAPVLLVVLRILQGMGAGAEGTTAIILAYEHARSDKQGSQAAWPALGSNIGLLASSLVVAGLTSLDRTFLDTWGWRIPFLASIALVMVGMWVRRTMPETPEFEKVATTIQRRTVHTVRDVFRRYWRSILLVMVYTIGYNAASYTFKTFSLTYLQDFRDVAANIGALGVTVGSALAILTVPVVGRVCDAVGPKRVLVFGALGTAAMAFPFFWLLDTGEPLLIWLAFAVTTGVVVPSMLAASGSYTARQFIPHVRVSGVSLGREVGGAFAGGLAPLVALSLVAASTTHATWAVSLLFVGCGIAVAVACLADQSRRIARLADAEQADEPRPAGSVPTS